jgi:hypothetical protein
MNRTPFDDLLHRVNNLLGTIELQAEVAKGAGLEAQAEALAQILASARRTAADVQRLRSEQTKVRAERPGSAEG